MEPMCGLYCEGLLDILCFCVSIKYIAFSYSIYLAQRFYEKQKQPGRQL